MGSDMKILVISHMYPSSQNETYGIFVHKQVKALAEQGVEVKVISPVPYAPWPLTLFKKKWRSYATIPKRDIFDGIEVYYARYPQFPRSLFLEHLGYFIYRGLRRLVKRISAGFKFDLIQAHVALPDGHAGYLLKKDYQVPLIVTVHGQDFQSTVNLGEKPRAKLTEVLNGADRIITVSSKLKNMVIDQPYASKIEVINNGIDLADIQHNGSSHKNPNQKLISVSNLKKTKGIDLNIKAVAALALKYPGLTYYIIGDGEERQNLENLADSLKVRKNVVFLGKLSHTEVMNRMSEADIFCLPSWQEGFGVVYIEAMAQGLPVIGVKGEGIEDVIIHEQNGLLVRPQNVEDIVKALETLLKNPDLACRLAETGRQTVIHGFTWSHNAGKTLDVYQRTLGYE